jgi:hypothetical protein
VLYPGQKTDELPALITLVIDPSRIQTPLLIVHYKHLAAKAATKKMEKNIHHRDAEHAWFDMLTMSGICDCRAS